MAYVMSRFPKITETFILYEMRALQELGAHVEVFPLRREPDGPRHPEAVDYEARAHFAPFVSGSIVRANWRKLRRDPGLYVRTWWHALRRTWGSPRFFLGALVHYPKCVLFAEQMERLAVDHIHAHFATHPALAALLIHRLTGIPYSFTAHGSDLHVDRTMLADKVDEASFVVAVSAYNRSLILEECGQEHADEVVVIHCGADPSVFGDEATGSRLAGISDSGSGSPGHSADPALRVACVASLEEVKGHRFLLQACRLLIDRGVDVRCDLAGGGGLRKPLERLVDELSLRDHVGLHGAVPRPEVRRILSEADVAVLASYPTADGRREGIPVALMEAMMSGLPVVASGLSGIPELVDHGHTGYLVAPGDPWSLADRLEELAASPELRRRMGAAGRCKVVTEFDLTRTARLLLQEIRCRVPGLVESGHRA
ncbi:MAG TPA: glycosyltransferase [Longimicrobiales bacterium]|nr:glycosyltransferase [Longimicrobiales bacterium]